MPGHTGGHSGKKGVGGKSPGPRGQKGQFGGSKKDTSKSSSKSSTKSGKKEGKSFSDRLREKQLQNQAQREQLQRNLDKIKSGTAVRSGKGFLRNQGDIVTYSGGKKKRDEDAKNRAAELAQKELEQQGITASLDVARRMMEAERQTLLDRAKQNQITGGGLTRLGGLNRMFGANPTTGMGLGESLRFQGRGLAQDLPGLAKVASAIAGGPAGIASLVATGGRGIGNLVLDALGRQQSERQPNLAESRDDDQGGLQSLLAGLRIGEGAPFVEDRRQGRDRTAMLPPVLPPAPAVQQVAQAAPITGQPVDSNILNQYLALAGFSPQEIQGFAPDIRFI